MQEKPFALGTFSLACCAPFAGLVIDDRAIALRAIDELVSNAGPRLTGTGSILDVLENWTHNVACLQAFAGRLSAGEIPGFEAASVPVSRLRTHAPIPQPRQIFCTGANYRSHVLQLAFDQPDSLGAGTTPEERRAISAAKMEARAANGLPYAFIKLASAVTGPYDPIVLPRGVEKPDWELELAVVMGRPARRVRREDAMNYVAGYTIGNDISARERLYRHDLRTIGTDWLSCKSAPTFLPLGPYLVPSAFVPQPQNLGIQLSLNGEVMQDARTSEMIFDIARQIEYLSERAQLWPGDVIMTGSPAGNGTHYKRFLAPGDVVTGRIDGLGELRNTCVAEECL